MNKSFYDNQPHMEKARRLLREQWFHDFIDQICKEMYPYRLEDIHGDDKSERLGGHKAVVQFLNRMRQVPFKVNEEEQGDEILGFVEPSSIIQFKPQNHADTNQAS